MAASASSLSALLQGHNDATRSAGGELAHQHIGQHALPPDQVVLLEHHAAVAPMLKKVAF